MTKQDMLTDLINFVMHANHPNFIVNLSIGGNDNKITISAWAGGQQAGIAPSKSVSFSFNQMNEQTIGEAKYCIDAHRAAHQYT